MLFGMCNAPAMFQRLMNMVLSGCTWKLCFMYIDEVLVCSSMFDVHLQEVFTIGSEKPVSSSRLICFHMRQINYPKLGACGHKEWH